jgi:ATP-binding cassette, subfamily B, bacterial
LKLQPAHTAKPRPNGLSLRELLAPYRWQLLFGFLAAAGESAADLLEPWPLKIVIDDVLKGRASNARLTGWIHQLVGADALAILKFACFAVLAIAVLNAVCSYGEKYFTTSVGQWISYDLRRRIYAHIQKLSLAFHDNKRTGDLISRVTDDIDSVQSFITSGLLTILIDVITLVGMAAVMFYTNWRFTLIALSVAPVLFLVVYSYTRRIKKASRAVRKKEGEITSVVEEVLSSMRVVKAFAREDYEVERLEHTSREAVEIALRARGLKAKLTPFVDLLVAVGTCLVLWFGARLVMASQLSVGDLFIFVSYLSKMYKPMRDLSKMTDTYTKASVGYERIREVVETDKEIKDARGAITAPRLKGEIEFDHVSFHYNADTPVLDDVSLHIEPGQVAALVGPTGAGKTSIVSLVARFYDPTSGVVKVDGQDVRRYRQRSLRQQISFVLQETVLFHGTLWENIAYGKPEATPEEIVRAAELANASEFIDKLPQRYHTLVGERGITLSGGQRQRIAIARAIIRDSPILILDEPTSGLDAASEKLVFEALDRLMETRDDRDSDGRKHGPQTVIVIAHRLSTIRRADVIFVVDERRIIESGKHDELLARRGVYAQLHGIQFGEEPPVERKRA